MTTVRKYLSTIREGRIILTKSDGNEFSGDELTWINDTITRQLRTDLMVETKGYKQDGALHEPDTEVGFNSKTQRTNRVHPLVQQLKALILKRKWHLAKMSNLIGMRDTALSEWMRGLMQPKINDVAAAYGLLGYRLVAVPFSIEADVQKQVDAAEKELMKPILQTYVGYK